MNKRIGVVGLALVLSFVLIGGMLFLAQKAETAIPAETRVGATQATTLTLSIPDVPIANEYDVHKTIDFLDYTTYDDDPATLSFTVTQTSFGSYLLYEIVDGHYFSITVNTSLDRAVDFDVTATDGTLTDTQSFSVLINPPPVFDTLPNQTVTAGESKDNVLNLKDETTESGNTYKENLTYTFVVTPPIAAGITIDGEDNIDLNPELTFEGVVPVDVQVQDAEGLTDTASFTVTVVGVDNTAPEIFIPDQALRVNDKKTLDLNAYASDVDSHDQGNLAFTVTQSTPVSLNVSITDTNYLNLAPATDFEGQGMVAVQVQDSFGVTATTAFSVYVTDAFTPTIALPDMEMAAGEAEVLDLWNYTSYFEDEKSTLVYTATLQTSGYFTAYLTGTHYLNLASTSVLTGGAFATEVMVSDGVRADQASFTMTVTVPPTLSLSIPKLYLQPDGHSRLVDLWPYTQYNDDKAGLTYIVTQTYGTEYAVVELANSHYLSMTSFTSFSERSARFDVYVTDGTLAALIEDVRVEINNAPEIDFFPNIGTSLPDPVHAYAGSLSYLSSVNGGDPTALHHFTYDEDYDPLSIYFPESPPVDLGAFLTRTTEGDLIMAFQPDKSAVGNRYVEVGVVDQTSGFTHTDFFTVTVFQQIFLPLVKKNDPPVVWFDPIENPDGDAIYELRWEGSGDGYYNYDLQYSKDDPSFSNPTTIQTSNNYRSINDRNHYELIKPGTYYWRARVQGPDDDPNPWSNVRSVTVGNFAYLYAETLCAFSLRIEVWGNGQSIDETYYKDDYCNDTVWLASVPAGTYSARLTWVGGSIVDNVGATALGNDRYIIIADQRPPSWKPY